MEQPSEFRRFNYFYYVRLIIAVLIAFAGTYYALPARGLISTAPVYLVAAFLLVFVKIPLWQKTVFFGVCAFIFTSLYYPTIYAAVFAAICMLSVIAFSSAFYLVKKKKLLTSAISVLLVCACVVPHAFLFGNISDGMKADKQIKEYVSKHYTSEGIVVSGTYYDFKTGYYRATVYDNKAPTEKYSVSLYDSILHDSFIPFSEINLMEKRRLEVTEALRDKFPNEKFSVTPIGISGYPYKDQISLSDNENYNDYMRFRINLSGVLYKKEFAAKADFYYNTLIKAKVNFREIVFVGGGDYLNAYSISVPCDLFPKDMEKLVKPTFTKFGSINFSNT